MKYDSRIKKLEKSIDEIKGFSAGLRYVFKNPDESTQECLARHGLEGDLPGLTVFIHRWATSDEHEPPSPQQPAATEPK